MSQPLVPEEKSCSGFLLNLLVLVPAVICSLFIGGSALALIAGGVTVRKHGTSAPTTTSGTEILAAPTPLAAPVAANAPVIPAGDTMAQGQQIYLTVCIACHQPTGMGIPNLFPSLATSDWVQSAKPDRLIAIVLHGLQGPITLNGQQFTTTMAMAPLGTLLKDEQIAAVLTYVRASFGNKAGAVATAQVSAIRERTKSRSAMWTAQELNKDLATP